MKKNEEEREKSVGKPPCKTDEASPVARTLTRQELLEQLYHEGTILNVPTRKPLTEEEKAERAQLSQALAGGKPLLANQLSSPIFVCADKRLVEFACAEGLVADNPQDHPSFGEAE